MRTLRLSLGLRAALLFTLSLIVAGALVFACAGPGHFTTDAYAEAGAFPDPVRPTLRAPKWGAVKSGPARASDFRPRVETVGTH